MVAGDFNLDVDFHSSEAAPAVSAHARSLVRQMRERLGLDEATSAVRGSEGGSPLSSCRPTFAYSGAPSEGGPPERRLTTFGVGETRGHKCDDAVFFRGWDALEVAEDSLVLAEADRPHPLITHISDHWAVRVKLGPRPLESDRSPRRGARDASLAAGDLAEGARCRR